MSEFNKIDERLRSNGDVLTVTMQELRDAKGVRKLGKHVVKSIARELEARGIGHAPKDLPLFQDHSVRLYRKGTAVGDLVHAVRTQYRNDEFEKNQELDERLRSLASNDAEKTLEEVRILVCR